jgi:hypothetical protein
VSVAGAAVSESRTRPGCGPVTAGIVLAMLGVGCGSSKAAPGSNGSAEGGITPTSVQCTITLTGNLAGTFDCDAAVSSDESPGEDEIRLVNLASATQPISIQVVCDVPHPVQTGSFFCNSAVIQELFPDGSYTDVYLVESAQAVQMIITSVTAAPDGGVLAIHGSTSGKVFSSVDGGYGSASESFEGTF